MAEIVTIEALREALKAKDEALEALREVLNEKNKALKRYEKTEKETLMEAYGSQDGMTPFREHV